MTDPDLPNPESPSEPTDDAASPAQVEWSSLGLHPDTLAQIEKAGFKNPTPVQAKAIPAALDGRDVIASAQTGTGKTAAFVLPVIEAIVGRKGTFAVILAPTREIAQQIDGTLKLLGEPLGVTSAVFIGGVNLSQDEEALAKYPNVLVATPGRLCDHLERGNIWLEFIEILVLDEADRMLDMGFSDQLKKITDEIPEARQTLLFSATITPVIERLADRILYDPVSVSVGRKRAATESVEQKLLWMHEDNKRSQLRKLVSTEKGSIIVFVRSKEGADNLWRRMHGDGYYDVTCIHSDRLQANREMALQEFKEGKFRILIATDVVGRGIHVDNIAHVVNYDLPRDPDDYIHRIGRTGRLDAKGKSTTFVTYGDRRELAEIEKLLKMQIPEESADGTRPMRIGEGGGGGGPSRGGPRGGRGGGRGGRSGRGGGGGRGPRR